MDGEGGGRGGRVVHIDGIVRDDGRKWKKKIRLARQSTFLSFLSLFLLFYFFIFFAKATRDSLSRFILHR